MRASRPTRFHPFTPQGRPSVARALASPDLSLRTSDRCHWCGNPFSLPSTPQGRPLVARSVLPPPSGELRLRAAGGRKSEAGISAAVGKMEQANARTFFRAPQGGIAASRCRWQKKRSRNFRSGRKNGASERANIFPGTARRNCGFALPVAEKAKPEFPQRSEKWSKRTREHFSGHRKAEGVIRRSPARRMTEGVLRSLFTVHRSLFSVHCSPFSVHFSRFSLSSPCEEFTEA